MSARTILTLANGRGIDLLNPRPSDIHWPSFAEQLAKEKRFNGATPNTEYSVAEHQVRGANAILEATGDRMLAAYFSVHDTHEAVIKDDTTPKKRAIAELAQEEFGVQSRQVIETFDLLTARLDAAIHAAAGLAWPVPARYVAALKRWDLIMFVTEWRDLMRDAAHPNPDAYRDIRPLADRIEPWSWIAADINLIDCWKILLPALRASPADEEVSA